MTGEPIRFHPWRDQPPLIGPADCVPHHVEYDPRRGQHRCLPDCQGYHPDDEDEQLSARPVTVQGA